MITYEKLSKMAKNADENRGFQKQFQKQSFENTLF